MTVPILGIIVPNMGTNKTNLSDALFSKVQQRVLGLLFGQSDRVFYTNEIIRLTHSGTGAVQRELAKLAAVGLITLQQIGNQKQYQANQNSPLYSELRSIVLKTFGLADVLREVINIFGSKIQFALIYGSVAKQEDTASSDIDLMLIGTLSYADLYPILEKSEHQLGRRINPTCYSASEWIRKKRENNNFVIQVLSQPKIFLIGTEDEFGKLK